MAVTSADYMLMVESSSPVLKLQQCHSIRIKSRYYSLHMHYELKKNSKTVVTECLNTQLMNNPHLNFPNVFPW